MGGMGGIEGIGGMRGVKGMGGMKEVKLFVKLNLLVLSSISNPDLESVYLFFTSIETTHTPLFAQEDCVS